MLVKFGMVCYGAGMIDLLFSMILIKAINPGYSVGGKSNAGEMVEIVNIGEEDTEVSGMKVDYTLPDGETKVTLYAFPEGSKIAAGKSVILRYSGAPEKEEVDATYTKTIAFAAGPLELVQGEEIVDSVCWTGANGCQAKFVGAEHVTLVRNLETREFVRDSEYVPTYDAENPGLILVEGYGSEEDGETGGETTVSQCNGLIFSEILTYYETSASEQFIEFYNASDHQILLNGCGVKYKNKLHALSGVVQPEGYIVYYPDFTMTKNPTTQNELVLVDTTGEILDTLVYFNGQRKAVAYAQFGYGTDGTEQWLQTYAATPGEANNYRKYKTCTDGKVVNEETGNCVKATAIDTEVEPCPAGKYRNPLTGRCKSYETEEAEKTCAEGYYLNPETNRCKKITDNTGAGYALTTENYEENTTFIAIWAVIGVVVCGVAYVGWQYRSEIKKLYKKIVNKIASRSGGQS